MSQLNAILFPWAIIPCLLQVVHGVCQAQTGAEFVTQAGQWGAETLSTIDRDFLLSDRPAYAEEAKRLGPRPTEPVFMWGAGVQLSALAAAARVNPERYRADLVAYAHALDAYWVKRNGVGGYDVLPVRQQIDRYYDDNAWIVLAMVETFDVTHDRKYLEQAAATMRFVLSGEDESLGGGIYWRENHRDSKNTCSNAPAVVGAQLLYERTQDPQYLAAAKRLYNWTREQLQDGSDGLYWDNVNTNGRVDRKKYSYNSAVMIRANCLLYEITGDAKYLPEAQRIAESAADRWIDPKTGAVKDSGRFAHMLLESLAYVDRATGKQRWRDTVQRSVAYLHQNSRDPLGHYPNRWDAPQTQALDSFTLIDQASAARAYFFVAHAFQESKPR